MASKGEALHGDKDLLLIAKDDLPVSFAPKDQNYMPLIGSYAVSLAN